MKHVQCFSSVCAESTNAFRNVERKAGAWFAEHASCTVLDSHTNIVLDNGWTEFVLTLIVELPDAPTPQMTPQEAYHAIVKEA